MSQPAEIPDSHVVDLADQFLDTAALLLANIPKVGAPSALSCNAALAIELYLKSLNSHWVLNETVVHEGIESSIVTTKANIQGRDGHRLNVLFEALPRTFRDELATKFTDHVLAKRYENLQAALNEYADTFVQRRYGFESCRKSERRPIRDIVELATFFRDYVRSVTRIRY